MQRGKRNSRQNISRQPKPHEPLPIPCDVCRAQGGLWIESADGLSRCQCERGRALALGLPRWRKDRKRQRDYAARIASLPDGKAAAGMTFS